MGNVFGTSSLTSISTPFSSSSRITLSELLALSVSFFGCPYLASYLTWTTNAPKRMKRNGNGELETSLSSRQTAEGSFTSEYHDDQVVKMDILLVKMLMPEEPPD